MKWLIANNMMNMADTGTTVYAINVLNQPLSVELNPLARFVMANYGMVWFAISKILIWLIALLLIRYNNLVIEKEFA